MSNTSISPIDKPNQFPWKLYDMLLTAEKRNEEHIISWIRGGKAFKVHNRNLFIEEYMKKMFNQTKYKSFQRQLNLWGFERVQNGPDKGSYFHPLFLKGRRDCCQCLTRVRLKGTGEKAAQHGVVDSPEQEYSPISVASATAGSFSAPGATKFPSAALPVTRVGNVATAALLGASVGVPGPTSTTAVEASLQGTSGQQQFVDLIHYHTSQQRREMIRNAAIGLRPDLSLAVVGAPLFATAFDTTDNVVDRDLQRDQLFQKKQMQKQKQHDGGSSLFDSFGSKSRRQIRSSPRVQSCILMSLSMAFHFGGYEFVRSAALALFTSTGGITGFNHPSAYPFAIGCVTPTTLSLLYW